QRLIESQAGSEARLQDGATSRLADSTKPSESRLSTQDRLPLLGDLHADEVEDLPVPRAGVTEEETQSVHGDVSRGGCQHPLVAQIDEVRTHVLFAQIKGLLLDVLQKLANRAPVRVPRLGPKILQ